MFMLALLYTMTGSFTMCSALSSPAPTYEMTFSVRPPLLGVAVIESTNSAPSTFSISIDSLVFTLWLSSTTTMGRSLRMTCTRAVSGVSAISMLRSLKWLSNF